MTNEEKLKILIEAHNRASKAFEDVNKSVDKTESRFEKFDKKLQSIADGMKRVGTKMTTRVTLPIVAGAGLAVKAFSDLNETMNKVDVSFGENANSVKEWSEQSIESMGLAQQSALDAAALFGDMGTGMGQTTAEASKMSMNLTQLGADMASFKNVSFDRAQTALAGIYTGETEALKSLGIVMTQTNLEEFARAKGIKKSVNELTQAEKVQLRYEYVMEKTKNAQGDFVRTSDGIANQTRMTGEKIKQLSADFGEKLAPAMLKILEVGGRILDWFTNLSDGQQKAILVIAGFVAALGPAIMIIGHLITAIRGIGIALTFLGAHPIILVIMAVIAVIAGLAFLIIKNWDTLKRWFGTFWQFVKDLFAKGIEFIKKNWDKLLPIILGPLGLVIVAIVKNWDKIKAGFSAVVSAIKSGVSTAMSWLRKIGDFFGGLKDKISGGLSTVGDIIKKPFTSAFDAIKNLWNSTVGKLSFKAPDWVPGIGGKGWSMPKLYTGVRNFSGGPAVVGDINGRGGEIVSLPRGTDVFSNRESKQILRNLASGSIGGGGMTFNNYGEIRNETAEASEAFWRRFNRMSELAQQGVPTNG